MVDASDRDQRLDHHADHGHGDPWLVVGLSLIVFPKLALGLSGFETGVAVMPTYGVTRRTRRHDRWAGSVARAGCSPPQP